MPKIALRFDLATILLASMLTVLGISAAEAGGSPGGVLGDKSASSGQRQAAGAHESAPARAGGRGGIGGDL